MISAPRKPPAIYTPPWIWWPIPPEAFYPLPTADADDGDAPREPAISRFRRFTPQNMTVAEAAETMERNRYEFLLFLNDDLVNILYRRKDDTFGLLEPHL